MATPYVVRLFLPKMLQILTPKLSFHNALQMCSEEQMINFIMYENCNLLINKG